MSEHTMRCNANIGYICAYAYADEVVESRRLVRTFYIFTSLQKPTELYFDKKGREWCLERFTHTSRVDQKLKSFYNICMRFSLADAPYYYMSAQELDYMFDLMGNDLSVHDCGCRLNKVYECIAITEQHTYVAYTVDSTSADEAADYVLCNNKQTDLKHIYVHESPEGNKAHMYKVVPDTVVDGKPWLNRYDEASDPEDWEGSTSSSSSSSSNYSEESEEAAEMQAVQDLYSDTHEEYMCVAELLDTIELYYNSTSTATEVRGDERGDITNCLSNGYLIQHKCGSSTWYGVYHSATNIVLGFCLSGQATSYRRGDEVCPIQDFCVAHLKSKGKSYTDNSWRECQVFSKWAGKIKTVNLGVWVKMYFSDISK